MLFRSAGFLVNLPWPFIRGCRTTPASGTIVGGLPPNRGKIRGNSYPGDDRVKVNRHKLPTYRSRFTRRMSDYPLCLLMCAGKLNRVEEHLACPCRMWEDGAISRLAVKAHVLSLKSRGMAGCCKWTTRRAPGLPLTRAARGCSARPRRACPVQDRGDRGDKG